MNIIACSLKGLFLVEPKVFGDSRGFFKETYSQRHFAQAGLKVSFVQDNASRSCRGVLRGLHLQIPHTQGKLVSVLDGEVFDVAVDLRKNSPTFGQWEGFLLSADNHRQLYIPEGFAHGFLTMSDTALFVYKCSDFYHPECEITIQWNDPDIGIKWPQVEGLCISDKDRKGLALKDIDCSKLSF